MSRDQAWSKNLQLLLVAIIAFNVLPHISSIPIWTTAIALTFLVWKVLALVRGLPRPPRWFLWSCSIACMIGVFFEYRTILGQEAASALLVTLASAKLLETNRYRDAMFVIFTSFFLLMAHLLDSQSILSTIFMAVDVMLITALMFQLHKQERRQSARSFRPVMKTLGLAIPVWIFLFVVFPRFSAGFWGLKDTRSSPSGFAEDLDPGGLEELTQSDATAFRVVFKGSVPPVGELYWRGAILTEGNGLIWTKAKSRNAINDIAIPPTAKPRLRATYKTYLEPRFQDWVFALDYPEFVTPSQIGASIFRKRPGLIFENTRSNGGLIVYDGVSVADAPSLRLLNEDRERLVKLPPALDPRIRTLAAGLANEAAKRPLTPQYPTRADLVADQVIEWFMNEHFGYTKAPGALRALSGSEQLSEFLFSSKRGFCEHYSAAFATLMRAAGIPARVVLGFQGASRNEYGDYFVVRDLDAHAWTEIWRDDPQKAGIGRWVRVDPTQFIAPLRIQMGGDFNLLDPSSYASVLTADEARLRLGLRNTKLYEKALAAWDAAQMKWNAFLSDYDFEFQKSFLENFGLKNMTRWTLFLVASLGVLFFALILSIVLRRRALHLDPVLSAWRLLCRKLERAGIARRANEGPLDFTDRASRELPHATSQLRALGETYAALRYGPKTSAKTVRDFRRLVRSLSLKN